MSGREELSAERKSQVGGGGRSEKIRTYNYKENRVTDHRIGFTIYRLTGILAGDLAGRRRRAAGRRARQVARRRLMTDPTPSADGTISWRQLWDETARGDRRSARRRGGCARSRRRASTAASSTVDLDEPATVRMVAHLDAMIARQRAGEPLQYVLGEWDFRRLDLVVDRRVLIPRPETELVAEVAIEMAAVDVGPTRAVADLGTGSGAIGLSLAHELPRRGTTVWLTDVSSDALDVARANLAGIGRAATNVQDRARIVVRPAARRRSSSTSSCRTRRTSRRDRPTSNRSSPSGSRPRPCSPASTVSTTSGSSSPAPPSDSRPCGWLVLEIGADQGAAVGELLHAAGYADVEIRPDLAGHDRIALARRP